MSAQSIAEAAHRRLHAVQAAYQTQDERPLGSYAAVMGVYGSAVTAAALLARATGRGMPVRPSAGDLAVLAIATHKATRLLTKTAVTSPLRAPFTRHAGSAGEGEVMEEVRAEGLGHSVGELLTCPFCASVGRHRAHRGDGPRAAADPGRDDRARHGVRLRRPAPALRQRQAPAGRRGAGRGRRLSAPTP
nr:DUF1360 domain-containing protein [Kineococcus rubinsiae]